MRLMQLGIALGVAALSGPLHAALIAHYPMDQPTPLDNPYPLDANRPAPDMVDPGGANAPTHLAPGGVGGSGAYQFDGTDDYFSFASPGYLFLGNGTSHNWTFSFWIQTDDDASNTAGYAGTPQVPVLGDVTNNIDYGIGIDGGKATMKVYSGAWHTRQGVTDLTDGQGHFVTMTLDASPVGDDLLNFYIDGQLDFSGTVPPGGPDRGFNLGRSYATSTTHKYGAFILDDVRIYDTVLTQSQILSELSIPEPVSGASALLGAVTLMASRRRRA